MKAEVPPYAGSDNDKYGVKKPLSSKLVGTMRDLKAGKIPPLKQPAPTKKAEWYEAPYGAKASRPGMPAVAGGDTHAAAGLKAVAPPPVAKLPTPDEHAKRATMLSSFTPSPGTAHLQAPPKAVGAPPAIPAAAALPGVAAPSAQPMKLTGVAKIRAAARQPIASQAVAPKLAMSEKDGAKQKK